MLNGLLSKHFKVFLRFLKRYVEFVLEPLQNSRTGTENRVGINKFTYLKFRGIDIFARLAYNNNNR